MKTSVVDYLLEVLPAINNEILGKGEDLNKLHLDLINSKIVINIVTSTARTLKITLQKKGRDALVEDITEPLGTLLKGKGGFAFVPIAESRGEDSEANTDQDI